MTVQLLQSTNIWQPGWHRGRAMCCHLPWAAGKAKEGNKNLPFLLAMAGTLVPSGLCHRVQPVLAVLGCRGAYASLQQRYGCMDMAGTLFPTPAGLVGEIVGSTCPDETHWCQSTDLGSAHGGGSRPAWLAVPQACCGSRPAQPLSLQPCVMGYPKTLLGGEVQ